MPSKQYYLNIFDTIKKKKIRVYVRENIYREYTRIRARIQYRNDLFEENESSFSVFMVDDSECGEFLIKFVDDSAALPEKELVKNELYENPNVALSKLYEEELSLVYSVFFKEISVQKYAIEKGISIPAAYKRREKILRKLRLFME